MSVSLLGCETGGNPLDRDLVWIMQLGILKVGYTVKTKDKSIVKLYLKVDKILIIDPFSYYACLALPSLYVGKHL